jgi:hypothetical protein
MKPFMTEMQPYVCIMFLSKGSFRLGARVQKYNGSGRVVVGFRLMTNMGTIFYILTNINSCILFLLNTIHTY